MGNVTDSGAGPSTPRPRPTPSASQDSDLTRIAMAVGEAVKHALTSTPSPSVPWRRNNTAPPAKRFRGSDGGYSKRDSQDIR
eukprot:138918-Chlamydomonas_euryale.AAC.1